LISPLINEVGAHVFVLFVKHQTWRGWALKTLGEFDTAFECYQRATELNPNDNDARIFHARLLIYQYRFDEAIELCEEALAKAPDSLIDDVWLTRGQAFHKRYLCTPVEQRNAEDEVHANACWEKAIGINAAHRGIVHLYRKDYESSLSYVDELINDNPRATAWWNNKGRALQHIGRYEEALECFKKVGSLAEYHPTSLTSMAQIFLKQGLIDIANEAISKAAATIKTDRRVLFNLGCILEAQGRTDEAIVRKIPTSTIIACLQVLTPVGRRATNRP
jgi:tetratricopeptide (TPR) repeat protein